MKKALKLIGKILLWTLCVILAVIIAVLGVLNIAKYGIYSEYFSLRTDVCENPGLNDGFVHQGICVDDSSGKIMLSGYMADDTASRIYITDTNNNSTFVKVYKDGKEFLGHLGGIAVTNGKVYLASEDAVHIISLNKITTAKKGDIVNIEETVAVNNQASFIYTDDKYLYVGEFHDGGKYVTEHPYTTQDGLYHAIISRYDFSDLTKPNKVYSIRDKVQGICFAEGKIVLSTSYGLADSVYYVYNEADCIKSDETLDGAEVYYVNNLQKEFNGPAMAEGLDYYNGKVITMTESASNKYIFGKFFFATKITALDVLKA